MSEEFRLKVTGVVLFLAILAVARFLYWPASSFFWGQVYR